MYKIFETVDDVSRYTAQRLLSTIQAVPNAALGLATGSTMEPVYAHFLRMLRETPVDISQLTTFNLDEYIGLGAEHAQSYHYYMHQHLFSELGLPRERTHLTGGMAKIGRAHV